MLTTPVLRALRSHFPHAHIGYLTKAHFADAIAHHPAIDTLHLYKGNLRQTLKELKAVGYDHVVDLHRNVRSFLLRTELAIPYTTFPKANDRKLLMTRLKLRLEVPHIVDRYAEAIRPLGAELDEQGLDFYYPTALDAWAQAAVQEKWAGTQPYALCLSASYTTKRWLPEYYRTYLEQTEQPVILLGGKAEMALAQELCQGLPEGRVWNTVGHTSLLQSAALLRPCTHLITPDTGMMHIAAALQVPSITLWGNTVPQFGMYPYRAPHVVVEEQLGCRPCSRLGHKSCPRGHFACMRALTPQRVAQAVASLTNPQ